MNSKSAMLFPGQGSQSVGMLDSLAQDHPVIASTFAEASDALSLDLWEIVSEGPAEELNKTEFTQPAMLTADFATWRVWQELGGPDPDCAAGHSLGEYAALLAADAFNFADAVSLVRLRGQLMQQATPTGTGTMAAILGLDDDVLSQICDQVSEQEIVSCANFNSPGQVVIAGHTAAVERASEEALRQGARKAIALPVSVPSHCSLMKEASERLGEELQGVELRTPRFTVLHNIDGGSRSTQAEIREALVGQLWRPVQWTRTVQSLGKNGVVAFAECGPGKVLSGLNRRIDRALSCSPLIDTHSIESTIASWSKS